MSDTYCASATCGTPTDLILCTDCAARLIQVLAEIPWLYEQLRITLSKQSRFTRTGPTVRISTEPPLVINMAATTAERVLTKTIREWQARTADHLGQPVRYPNPITATTWMLTAATYGKLATYVDAGHMLDQLTLTVEQTTKIIDRPAEKWFAGICSMNTGEHICEADLYATADKGDIECPQCGAVHDVANRRALLLKHAEEVLATATEAARAIVVWSDYERGENKLVARISKWRERGRITPRGHMQDGPHQRPTYRIGDILDLLADETHKKATG